MRATTPPATGGRCSGYTGPGNGQSGAASIAVGRGGGTVFVTGTSENDYGTVAYQAATGAQLWASRYSGAPNLASVAAAVAVSPHAVFVTGLSGEEASGDDYTTVAYNPATGAQLWLRRYNGPANAEDDASAVAVSPDGRAVFVTGNSSRVHARGTSPSDYATIAYRG